MYELNAGGERVTSEEMKHIQPWCNRYLMRPVSYDLSPAELSFIYHRPIGQRLSYGSNIV